MMTSVKFATGRADPRVLHASDELLDFLADWEGNELTAYQDSAGIWTIGVGHIRGVKPGQRITPDESQRLLRLDLEEAEMAVKRAVRVPLMQNEYDALVSWQFNTGGIAGSTLLTKLNAGDYDAVDDQMRRWNKAKDPKTKKKVAVRGLTFRRLSESEMWSVGDYRARNETAPYWETNIIPTKPMERLADTPMRHQPAIQATTVAGTGAVLSEAATSIQALTDYSEMIRWIFIVLTIAGVAYTFYHSWKAKQE